jgi:hypothetical protein
VDCNKARCFYLHILRWPAETIVPPAIPAASCASVLTGANAETKQSEMAIEVRVATVHRHAVDTILKRQLDGPAGSIATIRPS